MKISLLISFGKKNIVLIFPFPSTIKYHKVQIKLYMNYMKKPHTSEVF